MGARLTRGRMRRRLQVTFVALAAVTSAAGATRITRPDILPALHASRVARLGVADVLEVDGATLAREMLVDPASPYSDLRDRPSFMNDVDWPSAAASVPGMTLSDDDVLAVLRWDLGMTRARPGVDVITGQGYRDPFIAANAQKADVSPTIFWHMLDVMGHRRSTQAAFYAVALQILRTQLDTVPVERRASLGVDAAVYDRVTAARHAGDITVHDLRYLATLVQYRLVHWQGGGVTAAGLRQLPVAYRIARVAAAYRDAQGYVSAPPCGRDATAAPRYAGTGKDGDARPLCFVAATDRAVHRWYLDESRREAAWVPPRPEANGFMKVAAAIGLVFPLLEMVSLFEIVDAVIADDLVGTQAIEAADAEAFAERADLLTCHIPE